MKVAIEPSNDFDGLIRVVRDLVKVEIVRRNELVPQQVFADMLIPGLPVGAALTVDQHQRHELAFAGLHEREGLVTFVHRPETTREEGNRVRVTNKDELARE